MTLNKIFHTILSFWLINDLIFISFADFKVQFKFFILVFLNFNLNSKLQKLNIEVT